MINFKGLIAPTDVPTGDGRMFCAGKMTHRPLPLPLMAQFGSGGHSGATPVATMKTIYPGPGGYWAEGNFLDPAIVPEVPRAVYMIQERVLGPSVDLDRDYTVKPVPHPSRPDKKAALFEEYNVIGATLVPMPAFYQVHMSVENDQEKALLASAGVDLDRMLTPDQFAVESSFELVFTEVDEAQFNMMYPMEIMDNTPRLPFTVPGLNDSSANILIPSLQKLLACLTNLSLSLKHAHWNVTGPSFIAVHKMLDKMVDSARDQADTIGERIATLGGSPNGTLQGVVAGVDYHEEAVTGRQLAMVYLSYLDRCFTYAILEERALLVKTGELDLVTQDILTGQLQELEKNQWFVRSHLEFNLMR